MPPRAQACCSAAAPLTPAPVPPLSSNNKIALPARNRWWRSFATSASSALYLFGYSAFYFATKLDITKPLPAVLYFSYMAVISYGFACMTGAMGFYATRWFVRKIMGSIKID